MRFNHVFYLLLTVSAASAFLLPQGTTDAARPMVGAVLTPVAQPSRAVASWATGRWVPAERHDTRPTDQIFQENEELRLANVQLTYELAEMRKVLAEREKLGDIQEFCVPVTVLGRDDNRDALTLRSAAIDGNAEKLFALNDRGVVGTLIAGGKAGGQVRLITDPQSRVQAYFGTFRKTGNDKSNGGTTQFVRLKLPSKLVEGAGKNRMVCRNLPYADVVQADLKVGDWAVVDDNEWPRELQGRRLGVVTKITKGAKLMAEIQIEPESDLLKLNEVMIFNKPRR